MRVAAGFLIFHMLLFRNNTVTYFVVNANPTPLDSVISMYSIWLNLSWFFLARAAGPSFVLQEFVNSTPMQRI
jgi:hypothetical protein